MEAPKSVYSEMKYWVERYPAKTEGLGGAVEYLFEVDYLAYSEEYYMIVQNSGKEHLYEVEKYTITKNKNEKEISGQLVTLTEALQACKISNSDFWHKNINVDPIQRQPVPLTGYRFHTLFVSADYKTIIDILLSILDTKDLSYYDRNEDGLTKFRKSKFWSEKNIFQCDRFNYEFWLLRSHYNMGLSGMMISVENTPLEICRQFDLSEPINNWVFSKLEGIPCLVKFDYNNSAIYDDFSLEYFVTPFYFELAKNKIKSVLLSTDDEAFFIKTNPFLTDQERIAKIDFHTGKFIDPNNNERLLNESKKILGEFWDILSPVSKQAFPIGLELYKQLKPYNENVFDATPPSIQFSKCIEIEIEQKILLPFREYFILCKYEEAEIKIDLEDSHISRMTNFLVRSNTKAPELGTFSYFISIVINSKSRADKSVTIKAYKNFVKSFCNSEFLVHPNFLASLKLITEKYRNGSAHTKALTFSYLEEFYQMLIGKNHDGFLFSLLKALKFKGKFL